MHITRSLPAAQQELHRAAAVVQARLEADWAWVQKEFDALDLTNEAAQGRLRMLETRRLRLLELAELLEACEKVGPATDTAIEDANELARHWHGQYVKEVGQAADFAGMVLAQSSKQHHRPVPTDAEIEAAMNLRYPWLAKTRRFIDALIERRNAA
ncbi:hypothetical protein [Hymenobacter koreensis]|uniref:Uncharacterized protein n=1 Tax=Hymenobacter koreensis TaxID=1084523 RepID=A0ABP8JN49_9BACT